MERANERQAREILRHQGIDPHAGAPADQEGRGKDDDDANAAPRNPEDVLTDAEGEQPNGERSTRKRAASGEGDDANQGYSQPASGSASGTLPPPASPGVNMRDRAAAGHSPEIAARNQRNVDTLRAQAHAQAQRRVQAYRRGAKRDTEEPTHPEDARANNTDDPEISLVGSCGTRCGCCE